MSRLTDIHESRREQANDLRDLACVWRNVAMNFRIWEWHREAANCDRVADRCRIQANKIQPLQNLEESRVLRNERRGL